jgi:hypothetical protein
MSAKSVIGGGGGVIVVVNEVAEEWEDFVSE